MPFTHHALAVWRKGPEAGFDGDSIAGVVPSDR